MKAFDGRGDMTRREALRLLGVGAGTSVLAGAGLLTVTERAAAGLARAPQQGPIIRTLSGDFAPNAVGNGAILFHEHINMHYPLGAATSFSDDADLMVSEVRIAGQEGVAVIVDGGHTDMHRDLNVLKRVDAESGVKVVASGGYYMQRAYPPEIATKSADQIADDIVAEARRERFGAIGEIGQEGGVLTDDEQKVFAAVGKAQARTGLPVFTHNAYSLRATNVPREGALRQLDILLANGADPSKVCIGHVCCLDDPDAEIASAIAQRGAYVGFDRVTLNATMPDANRVAMAMKFVEAGHADKLLLSSDLYSARQLKSQGGGGFAATVTVFGPMLRDAGMSEAMLRSILQDNPRRFLAFTPKA
jgi:phosphotriesterase-related protein